MSDIEAENKPYLTVKLLKTEAAIFVDQESRHDEPGLYGVTDGKAIGTYLERKFQKIIAQKYLFKEGNSAKGIDFPELNVDMKTTSFKQPQSSSPFKSARQKIYGLGYSLLIFVYEKKDDAHAMSSMLKIHRSIFVDELRTADYQTTRGIRDIIERDGNVEDLVAFMCDRNIPVDEIGAIKLANELLINPPELGYLTISNALQWRLQYKRAIESAGMVNGIFEVR